MGLLIAATRMIVHMVWPRHVAALALALIGPLSLAPAAAGKPAYVVAEPASVDFGDVAPGASVTRTVTLQNDAHFTVHVRSLRPSCDCTVAKLPRDTKIDPGKTLDLTLTFNAKDKEGPAEASVVVLFAERIAPLRIEGKANVNRGIRFETLDVPGPAGGDVEVARLTGAHGQSFRVLSVDGRPPRSLAGVEGVTPAAVHHDVPIEEAAPSAPGFPGSKRWAVIETDDPGSPVVVVPALNAPESGPRPWTISKPLAVLGWMGFEHDEVIEVLLTGLRGSSLNAIERIDVDVHGAQAGLLGIEPAPSGMNARFYVRAEVDATGIVAASLRITAAGHTETMDVYGAASPVVP